MTCIKCGKEHRDYHFRVLHVETLHIRDFKEKRIQALGDFEEYDVCGDCARKQYDEFVHDSELLRKTSLPYALMILAGAVIAFLFRADLPILLFGAGMLICGASCLVANVRNRSAHKREMLHLGEEAALRRCAWLCLLECAPRKNDVNDITYIPVDEETLARKNGDLMILYHLVPEIAVEAWKRIHKEETA